MKPRNIYIIGAQSTGKTTLVDALKDHFTRYREQDQQEPAIVAEVARDVQKDLNIGRQDIVSSPEKSLILQTAILEAQHKAEIEAEAAGAWYIADRSGIDPIVYAHLTVGEEAAQDLLNSSECKSLEAKMHAGLVYVCEAGCAWLKDDGVCWFPDFPAHWDQFDQAFRKLLEERKIEYQIVPKDVARIDERVQVVLSGWRGAAED